MRDEIAAPHAGREGRRASIVYFGQLTDFQLADEESPARVEFLDPDPSGTSRAAWRPQEALQVYEIDQSIRAMNHFADEPRAAGRRHARADGERRADRRPGRQHAAQRDRVGGEAARGRDDRPEQRHAPTCPAARALPARRSPTRRSTPASRTTTTTPGSPAFYDPDVPSGQYAGWPCVPGADGPRPDAVRGAGLKVPSYSVFGNHDGLVQGNEDAVRSVEDIATGCVKPYSPATTDLASGARPGVPHDDRRHVVLRPARPEPPVRRQGAVQGAPRDRAPARRARLRVRLEGGGRGLARRGRVLRVEPAAARPLHRARHAVGGRHGPLLGRREHRRPPVEVARGRARRGHGPQRADRRVRATTRPAR